MNRSSRLAAAPKTAPTTTTKTMTASRLAFVVAALLAVVPHSAQAWYLPGSAPRSYAAGDEVPFMVNALEPMVTQGQINGVINYDYYLPQFHFCQPEGGPQQQSESLGSVLFGDRIYNSPIKPKMLQNDTCVKICEATVPPEDAAFINDRIIEEYAVNWMVDGLPVAELTLEDKTHEKYYSIGFALGRLHDEHKLPLIPPGLHNHFDIYIQYHTRSPREHRVVGATIWPSTTDSMRNGKTPDCQRPEPLQLSPTSDTTLAYTYTVKWVESPTPWATRWDHYLRVFDPRIHFFSLVNSIVIVAFLCIMVAMILMRTVQRDVSRYNAIDLSEDVQEDFGWKLVHGEVFRPPQHAMLLSIMVGSGAQLAAMASVTLVFALLGFLSPSNRGSLATVMIVCWTFFGSIAGYFSSRVYASLDGEQWRRNIFLTATLFPTVIFAVMHLLNFFLIGSNSSGAVPFGTMLALVALWFLINIPLTLIGSYVGIRAGGFTHPVRVNQIPRQIPPTVWYLRPWPSALLAGIPPFGAGFLELFFLLNSLFGTKVYYAFGFLALTFVVTSLTTATVTILMCYFHLCAEEYRWHWRAFITGGGSAFWLFAYGLFYWATRLSLPGFANKALYLGYLSLISLLDFMVFGTIGFLAVYLAMRRMYSAVRVD